MFTFRGVLTGAITSLLLSTGVVGTANAAALPPPSAPYTALTMDLSGWGYIDGSFSYEPSRNTVEVYQQTPNGYALWLRGFRTGGWHTIDVTPPIGTRFVAGTSYSTVKAWEPSPTTTVVNIGGDGQGCDWSPTNGSLNVTQAQYDDATGLLTAFAASFDVPCGGSGGTAKGEIRFQSTLPYKAVDSDGYRLQFGQQPIGFAGTSKEVTVEVFGTLPTTFGAASLSGDDPAAFEVSANTCSGDTLSYGESCTLTITPKATEFGEQTAVLTLIEDSIGGSVQHLLSLDGIDPRDAELSPSYLSFGYVPAYDTSSEMTVTVTGTGSVPITFGQAALSGENPDMFRVTSDQCSGVTLAAGQTCTVKAQARPTTGQGAGAHVVLPDNSVAGSTLIGLYVNGYVTDRGTYYPMSPYRLLDTRFSSGLLAPGGVIHLDLPGTVQAEASTVVLNVTVTGSAGPGHISVYPTGVPRPTVSSLNFAAGWTGANSVTVKVGANGQVDLYNGGSAIHIIVDVFGYYSKGRPPGSGYMGGRYHPISKPVRLVDTRTWGIGRIPGDAYIQAAAYWNTTINPRVRAFAVNVTATDPSGAGYLTAWNGYHYGLPNTSTLNYEARATVPNFAIVPTTPCDQCGEASGWPSIGVYTSNDSHIIVDIVGYYDDGYLPDGLRFEPIVPTRIVDTRLGQGWPAAVGAGSTAKIAAPGAIAGEDTWALATNVTAVQPTQNTFLTVWPADLPGVGQPGTSNLNPAAGSIVPNAVQTMIGLGNEFNVYNNAGNCHLVIDVVGRFEQYPPTAPPGWPNTSPSAMAEYNAAMATRRGNSGLTPTALPATARIKSL